MPKNMAEEKEDIALPWDKIVPAAYVEEEMRENQ